MSRWNLAWLLGVSAVTLLGLSLSYSFSTTPVSIHDKHDNVRLLIDVMDEVQAHYVKPLDKKQMREFTENMVNGGLEKLDPHSGFLGEEEYKEFTKHSEGKFGGVGIRIRVDVSGQIIVETPLVGTPAYNAGVLAGDTIIKVNGQSTESKSVRDVVDMIQGPPKTEVTLTVLHEGETKEEDLKMERAEIKIDSVMGDVPKADAEKKWDYMIDKDNRVAYIRVTAFTETTVAELTKVVQELQAEGMKGLIVDLRTNPGGLLRSAVQMSGVFLEEGKKVVSTKSRTKQEETYYAHPPKGVQKPVTEIPLVILINRYSASASEIVAAALKDHFRAILIGERSFGKGSVQNVIEMENGTSALKLTTASYWRPSGKNIHRFPNSKKEDDWGVKPDFEVKLETKELIEYFKYRREKDIILKPGGKAHPDREKILAFKDKVLEKATEVVLAEMKKKQDNKGAAAPAPLKLKLANAGHHLPQPLLHGEVAGPRKKLFWCQEESLVMPFGAGPNQWEETPTVPYYALLNAAAWKLEVPRLLA